MKRLYYYPLFLVMALLTACSPNIFLSGTAYNSTYRAPGDRFVVAYPMNMPEPHMHDGHDNDRYYVNFTSDGDWRITGLYSVMWMPTTETFYAQNHRVIPSYIRDDLADIEGSFLKVKEQHKQIDGRGAYQFVAVGRVAGVPATCVGTTINFGNGIVLAYLVYPMQPSVAARVFQAAPYVLNDKTWPLLNQSFPWPQYQAFINSIETNS